LRTNVLFQLRFQWLLAVLMLLVVGVSPAFSAGNESTPASARAVWEGRCVACHGAGGKGDGWRTKVMFWMKVPNLTDVAYMQTQSDEALLQLLKAGGKTGMPAYGAEMTEPQLKELVAFVRGFSNTQAPQKPVDVAAPAPQKPTGGAKQRPQKPAGAKR